MFIKGTKDYPRMSNTFQLSRGLLAALHSCCEQNYFNYQKVFKYIKEESSERELIPNVASLCTLLDNKYFQDCFDYARKNIFSRGEEVSRNGRRKQDTSTERYHEAVFALVEDLVGRGNGLDYTNLSPSAEMLTRLNTYQRATPTKESGEIKSSFVQELNILKPTFQKLSTTYHLLGSIRYGDAGKNSDVDGNFIVSGDCEENHSHWADLVEELEFHDPTSIINLSEYRAIFKDILEQATTNIEDYTYDGISDRKHFVDMVTSSEGLFHPYDWFLQGEEPVPMLPALTKEIAEIQTMMQEAAKIDPFFDFLLSYGLSYSIYNRKIKLNRK